MLVRSIIMRNISLSSGVFALAVCLVVAGVLFFRIGRADVVGDNATYLYRAVGLVDFLSSKLQTTPLQWFSEVPWWVRLQFHDAPPLAFWIMHAALALSGGAAPAARAPAARAPAALMMVIFAALHWRLIALRAGHLRAAAWVAIFISFTSLLTLGRTTLLESYMVLWLGAGLLAFFYTEKQPRAWYAVAGFFGAAVLTKYTALFVLVGPVVWLMMNRRVMRERVVQKAGIIFGAFLIIPFVYNVMMFSAAGHPDLQVSQALGINISKHWTSIQRAASPLSLENLRAATHLFFPSVWIIVAAVIFFVVRRGIKKYDRITVALTASLGATIVQMMFLGADQRFSAGFLVVCAMAAAYTCAFIKIPASARTRYGGAAVLMLCVLGGWTATAQNLYAYEEPRGVWRITGREANGGFNELDAVIAKYLRAQQPFATADLWGFQNQKSAVAAEYKRVSAPPARAAKPYRGVIIFDARISWFSSLWYFERWNLYGGFTLLSTADYGAYEQREPNFFGAHGFDLDEYSFVLALQPPASAPPALGELAEQTVAFFESRRAPMKIIRGPDGVARFKIFGVLAR